MMDKIDVLSTMQKTHDAIKEHPFRIDFAKEHISDYKYLLYKLSEDWCDYIYRCEHDDDEKIKLRQFGQWIHNYRLELRTYEKMKFPMEFFDYYEQIIQITHTFLDTGVYDMFYEIDYLFADENRSKRTLKVNKYEYITKEMCGIDSPILPRYFCMQTSMRVEDDEIWDFITKGSYTYSKKPVDEQRAIFEKWKRETKPVIEWVNAQHEETQLKHGFWVSFVIKEGTD